MKLENQETGKINTACPHFRKCGGCSWLDVPYNKQLEMKTAAVKEELSSFPECEISDIVPAIDRYYYRNKMEFTFGGTVEEPILGQHYKGSFHRIENLTKCALFDERMPEIFSAVRNFAAKNKLEPYNPKNHKGLLRHLKVRVSKTSGEMMIVLVTSGHFAETKSFADVFEKFPFVASIYHGINSRLSDIADCEELSLLKGKEYLEETVGGVKFLVSSESFFQPNTLMSAKMWEKAVELMAPSGEEYVLDLYSGSGGIGLYAAGKVKYVYAVEMQAESVAIFRENLKVNGIENAQISAGDVKKVLPLVKRNDFDFVFLDPPRSGMSKKAIKRAVSKNIKKIIFFSCKIETGAANLLELKNYGYKTVKAVPFDMFPQTPFMETVFLLEKCGN